MSSTFNIYICWAAGGLGLPRTCNSAKYEFFFRGPQGSPATISIKGITANCDAHIQ